MSEQCFNSYVKSFEYSFGNDSELAFKAGSISNLNDTIYGEFQLSRTVLKVKTRYLCSELIDVTCGKYDEGTDYDNVISVISGALTIITGSLGIIGNLISIVVLCQKYNLSKKPLNIWNFKNSQTCGISGFCHLLIYRV